MASSSSATGGGRFTADFETAIQHAKDALKDGAGDVEAAFAPLHKLLDQQRGDAPSAPAFEEPGPAPVTVVSQAREAAAAEDSDGGAHAAKDDTGSKS